MHERTCGREHGEPRLSNRRSGLNPRSVLKLIDRVPSAGQRQACVVTELVRHVDDAPSLVQQRREAVAQVVRVGMPQASPLDPSVDVRVMPNTNSPGCFRAPWAGSTEGKD